MLGVDGVELELDLDGSGAGGHGAARKLNRVTGEEHAGSGETAADDGRSPELKSGEVDSHRSCTSPAPPDSGGTCADAFAVAGPPGMAITAVDVGRRELKRWALVMIASAPATHRPCDSLPTSLTESFKLFRTFLLSDVRAAT